MAISPVGPGKAAGSHFLLNQSTISIVLSFCFGFIDELFRLDFVARGDGANRQPCPQYS
jgi:hypothetical protein